MVMAGSVLSSPDGFPESALLEGLFLTDAHCADGASVLDHDANTRALVTLGTRRDAPECIEADAERTRTVFYRNEACRRGRAAREEAEEQAPTPFEPRCLVLLLEASSRRALRDELVEAGRSLTEPLRIDLEYVTAQSTNPDLVVASTNCVLGRHLARVHALDLVGQAQYDAHAQLQAEATRARAQRDLFANVLNGLSAYRPPTSPPPPSAPPADAAAPPAAPAQVHPAERLAQLTARVDALDARVDASAAALGTCVPSDDVVCGRSSVRAPDPWIAASGAPCVGNATREGFEGAFCGYWGSRVRSLFELLP